MPRYFWLAYISRHDIINEIRLVFHKTIQHKNMIILYAVLALILGIFLIPFAFIIDSKKARFYLGWNRIFYFQFQEGIRTLGILGIPFKIRKRYQARRKHEKRRHKLPVQILATNSEVFLQGINKTMRLLRNMARYLSKRGSRAIVSSGDPASDGMLYGTLCGLSPGEVPLKIDFTGEARFYAHVRMSLVGILFQVVKSGALLPMFRMMRLLRKRTSRSKPKRLGNHQLPFEKKKSH